MMYLKTLLLFLFFAHSSVSAEQSMNFQGDLPVFKWIKLESFPEIKVPVYKSKGTQGPGVLFIHGNSSSSRAFHRQINSELGRKYRMFFMDLPGHGLASKVDSEKEMPLLPNSNMPAGLKEYQDGVMEAVKMVANDPEVQIQIVVGWSLGGHVAIKAYDLGYLQKVEGIFIFGTAPATRYSPIKASSFIKAGVTDQLGMPLLPSLGLSFELNPFKKTLFTLDAKFTDRMPWYTPRLFSFYPNRGSAYIQAFFHPSMLMNGQIPDFLYEDAFDRSDDRFRTSLAVLALEIDERLKDQASELEMLKNISDSKVTLGVALGEHDQFINYKYLKELQEQGYLNSLWLNEIKIIKDSGHASQLEQPEAFNRLIEKFISDVENR